MGVTFAMLRKNDQFTSTKSVDLIKDINSTTDINQMTIEDQSRVRKQLIGMIDPMKSVQLERV